MDHIIGTVPPGALPTVREAFDRWEEAVFTLNAKTGELLELREAFADKQTSLDVLEANALLDVPWTGKNEQERAAQRKLFLAGLYVPVDSDGRPMQWANDLRYDLTKAEGDARVLRRQIAEKQVAIDHEREVARYCRAIAATITAGDEHA